MSTENVEPTPATETEYTSEEETYEVQVHQVGSWTAVGGSIGNIQEG